MFSDWALVWTKNALARDSTQEVLKTLKEPVGPWARFQDKTTGKVDDNPFNFLVLGKKLKTSDLDKLYWVKFLQKKFPNLVKRWSKYEIEKELLKEFGDPEPTQSFREDGSLEGVEGSKQLGDGESKITSQKDLTATVTARDEGTARGTGSARESATNIKTVNSDNEGEG